MIILSTGCRANARRRRECSVTTLRKHENFKWMVLFVEKPGYDKVLNVMERKMLILGKLLIRITTNEYTNMRNALHSKETERSTKLYSTQTTWHSLDRRRELKWG